MMECWKTNGHEECSHVHHKLISGDMHPSSSLDLWNARFSSMLLEREIQAMSAVGSSRVHGSCLQAFVAESFDDEEVPATRHS